MATQLVAKSRMHAMDRTWGGQPRKMRNGWRVLPPKQCGPQWGCPLPCETWIGPVDIGLAIASDNCKFPVCRLANHHFHDDGRSCQNTLQILVNCQTIDCERYLYELESDTQRSTTRRDERPRCTVLHAQPETTHRTHKKCKPVKRRQRATPARTRRPATQDSHMGGLTSHLAILSRIGGSRLSHHGIVPNPFHHFVGETSRDPRIHACARVRWPRGPHRCRDRGGGVQASKRRGISTDSAVRTSCCAGALLSSRLAPAKTPVFPICTVCYEEDPVTACRRSARCLTHSLAPHFWQAVAGCRACGRHIPDRRGKVQAPPARDRGRKGRGRR